MRKTGVLVALALALTFGVPAQGRPQVADPAPITITDPVTITAGAADPAGRPLLVRVSAPAVLRGRLPVILFSHGSGLSRTTYEPLASWWAAHGYVVLQVDHPDAPVDGFAPARPPAADLWRTRITDMQRLVHGLGRIEAQVPALRGHVDGRRLLIAGHSFGAHTAAALIGMKVWNGERYEDFSEPAIRGAVLLSPPGSGGADLNEAFRGKAGYLKVDLTRLRGPLLVVVGSADDSKVMTLRDADWHEDIYRRSSVSPACLIVLQGGRHYLGGIVDPKRPGVEDADLRRLALVREASLAFFADSLAGRPPPIDAARNARGQATEECR